jgi:hypothetical protein
MKTEQLPITELPDGSGCFTAVVMSKEEALSLPLKERPLCFRISSEIYHAIFEAIGAASMCWNPPPSKEVFDSNAAEKIAVDLCFKIANELESKEEFPPRVRDESAEDDPDYEEGLPQHCKEMNELFTETLCERVLDLS